MKSRHIVWAIFMGLVVWAWVYFTFMDTGASDGAGMCACGGFMMLVILVIGTIIEKLTTKPAESRGFDVILKPPDGDAGERQESDLKSSAEDPD